MVAKNGKASGYDAAFGKFFEAFANPNFDFDRVAELQQRNFDALAEVNKVTAEGLQSIAMRQFEMVRDAFDEGAKVAQKIAAAKPDARFDESTKYAKSAFDRSIANFQELTDLAVKSQTQAFEKLSAAYLGAVDGLQSVAPAEKPSAK